LPNEWSKKMNVIAGLESEMMAVRRRLIIANCGPVVRLADAIADAVEIAAEGRGISPRVFELGVAFVKERSGWADWVECGAATHLRQFWTHGEAYWQWRAARDATKLRELFADFRASGSLYPAEISGYVESESRRCATLAEAAATKRRNQSEAATPTLPPKGHR